ncbi:TPA: excinuclease ABC subunit C [Streptococcus pyogenes]|nr:excinuclease ABC subunit C [Streptococcus pyogenes]
MNELIKHKLELLPDSPGCYLHKDKEGTIIYVGKAKNLKKRVRSYFRGSHDTKTELLVSEIVDFEYIVTESDTEALLLEINLIQKNMPKYNIKLKDDKSYPFLKITNESFPRLVITRYIKKNDGLYFGPYPDSYTANEVKKLLDRIFPFKKCKNPINKVCFYYHLGQCCAHTICHTDKAYWDRLIDDVKHFLNGKDDKIIEDLRSKMLAASEEMAFERAAEYRDLISGIATMRTKQRVMSKDLQDRDIFGYYVDKGWMCVQVFFVRQGKLIQRNVNLFPYYNDANDKHQTHDLLFGNPLEVVPLPRRSEEFFLLHRIQDEVHRFAVTFHRQVRRKNSFSSTLDHISGLGPKRKQLLLRHFKTITAIASATSEEIQALGIPKTVVEAIQQQITDNKNDRSSP